MLEVIHLTECFNKVLAEQIYQLSPVLINNDMNAGHNWVNHQCASLTGLLFIVYDADAAAAVNSAGIVA